MATKDPPFQTITAHLPEANLQNSTALASRLRNSTLYTFPESRHTIVSYAETIATKALLKKKNIPFTIIERENVNHMSPNSQVPLLVKDTLLAGGYDKITNLVGSVYPRLLVASPDTTAYCDLIARSLTPNIEYCQFLTIDTIREGSEIVATGLPFPLSSIVPLQLKLELLWKLYGKNQDAVYEELDTAMSELNTLIAKGVRPESDEHLVLSCKLYGYLRAVMEGFKEESRIRIKLREYQPLNQFYTRMEYF